ncbi:RE1 [Symbiodinium microadriaticum]|nr:RE1 [Symbiodinium microadriaticum]
MEGTDSKDISDGAPKLSRLPSKDRAGKKNMKVAGKFVQASTENLARKSRMNDFLKSIYLANFMAAVVLVDAYCTCVDIDATAAGTQPPEISSLISSLCLVTYTLEIAALLSVFGVRASFSDWFMALDLIIVGCGWAEEAISVFSDGGTRVDREARKASPSCRDDVRSGRWVQDPAWDSWRNPGQRWESRSGEDWQDRQWEHSWGKAGHGWSSSGWNWSGGHGHGSNTKTPSGNGDRVPRAPGPSTTAATARTPRISSPIPGEDWFLRMIRGARSIVKEEDRWMDGGHPRMVKAEGTMVLPGRQKGPSVPPRRWWSRASRETRTMMARSYLRQVSAWRRMTRMSKEQQGLTLYQHLTDRAWIDAERLDMDRLASADGVEYLISWIKDRYLDVQVTQVGRSLSDFFRRLRKKPTQPMREYMADFDRAYAGLSEVGCQLPDVAAAWVFVARMGLEESAELNLLASDWNNKRTHSANMADPEDLFGDHDNEEIFDEATAGDDGVPEEIAEDLYHAYMTHETANQRYRENSKLRGSDPDALRQLAAENLKMAKAKSFCSGCKRRGHWHKVDEILEVNATIPYIEETTSMASWEELSNLSSPHRIPPMPRPKAKTSDYKIDPDEDVPEEVVDEVLELEARTDPGHLPQDQLRDSEVFYECEDPKAYEDETFNDDGPEEDNEQDIDDFFLYRDDNSCTGDRGQRSPSMNPGGSGDVFQREPTRVNPALATADVIYDCEKTAKEKLGLKEFSYDDLIEVCRLIPLQTAKGKKGSNRGGGELFEYFLGGMYTYGKFFGMARTAKLLPWTAKYINVFARSKFSGPWSSSVLFRNTATQVHADVHNLAGSKVTSVTFGDFSGGELWIHEEGATEGVSREAPDGTVLYGKVISTKEEPYTFDGKLRHATQPWTGERWMLSCFTTRGFIHADGPLRDVLRELRFPLRGLPPRGKDLCEGEVGTTCTVVRPKKSMRRSLWKSAKRLATLTSWCTSAASMYLTDHLPLSRGPEAAVLFEIGGVSKTLEVADFNLLTVEPYEYDSEISVQENIALVHKNIDDFSPAVLWIHNGPPEEFLDGLLPVFHQHITAGKSAERAIRTWKEIWSRLVDEWSATTEEAGMIITAANTAMNTLRRESGFSPSQAVWGRDPRLPEDLKGTSQDEQVEHIISHDRLRAKEHSLRISAKEAYFKIQNDARLRRSLLQRSRVAGPDLQQGDHVFFYRKPKNNKNWEWHGPGVIIGHEGPSVWVSFAGRCHLVAPEHLRTASAEELGAAFSLRATQDDLQRLLEQDFGDEEMYEAADQDMDEDLALTPEGEGRDDGCGDGTRRERDGTPPPTVTKRIRTKGPQTREAHAALHEAYMMKFPKTPRGREKALEKELPWGMIPPEQHQGFKDAELRQWEEHVEHKALEALSIEESRQVLKDKPQRVLNSRFAYRDKLWSRRREQPDVGWKHKARLVISGHKDPDLLTGLPTHAPTISRQGILLLLQILASNLVNDWCGYAGDVTAAFLCGEVLQRELYLRQPRTGLGNLHPEQLLRIRKPIFGLVDSPAAWWNKFHKTLRSLEFETEDGKWRVTQCSLDHCIFMVQRFGDEGDLGPPQAYLGVHVDDVLLVGLRSLCEVIKAKISERFPICDWETEKFDYVGSFIEVKKDSVKISQASYAATRLYQVEIDKDIPDHAEVTEAQKHDNMSLIGALSWMASQTRPDLQVGVSMSQQRQKEPTAGDIRFTNQLARRAMDLKENGLVFHYVDLDSAALLCYHDAGWANVPQNQEDPYYRLTPEEDTDGLITDGPFARKDAKAKKANSSITSQLGGVYVLANRGVLQGEVQLGSILDWRSGACDRVCRSTFAAETMACSTATETGDYIARFLETLLTGKLERVKSRFEIRFLTDCRSLYDHLTRDGVPRVPTCKRLAVDLAGIREDLASYGKIVWVPAWAQLADVLTKPLKADQWWKTVHSGLRLTVVEERGTRVDREARKASPSCRGLNFRTAVLRALRLVRIFRLARALKRIRPLRELYKLAIMMATCFRALLWCFLLCFVVMTVWAMLIVEVVSPFVKEMHADMDRDFFKACHPQCTKAVSTVMDANLLLFKTVIAGDAWGEIAVPVIQEHPATFIIFIGSSLTLVFGVLNLIVAVVVDTFAESRQSDVQSLAEEMEDEIEHDRAALGKLFARMDRDRSGKLLGPCEDKLGFRGLGV